MSIENNNNFESNLDINQNNEDINKVRENCSNEINKSLEVKDLETKKKEYLKFINNVKIEDFEISEDLKTFKFWWKTYKIHLMKEAKNYEWALGKCSEINLDPVTMWINGNDIYINNIKEKFLLYFLMNEVLCPEVMGLKDIDGCLLSIKREYELVPDNLKEEYLKERKKFFDDTIVILTKIQIDLEYAKQLEKCVKFLESEIKNS